MARAVIQNVCVQLDLEVCLDGVSGKQLEKLLKKQLEKLLKKHAEDIRELLTVSLDKGLKGELKNLQIENSYLYFGHSADVVDVED